MKRMFSLALMVALVVSGSGLGAQDSTGVISGNVLSSTGRGLSGITVQLVDGRGTVVGKTETKDGAFAFPAMRYDSYTVQCIIKNKVTGTTSARLQAPTELVRLSCAPPDAAGAWWKHGSVVTGLVAAVSAVGAAAVVASRGDASGSR